MKLLRLILQGFKSFADKTTIEFADGMTAVSYTHLTLPTNREV